MEAATILSLKVWEARIEEEGLSNSQPALSLGTGELDTHYVDSRPWLPFFILLCASFHAPLALSVFQSLEVPSAERAVIESSTKA